MSIVPYMPSRRMCLDCHALTTSPIRILSIERQSGPPFHVYACIDHAPDHLTATQSLLQLFEHTHACEDCTPVDSCPTGYALALVHGRCLRRQRQAQTQP